MPIDVTVEDLTLAEHHIHNLSLALAFGYLLAIQKFNTSGQKYSQYRYI